LSNAMNASMVLVEWPIVWMLGCNWQFIAAMEAGSSPGSGSAPQSRVSSYRDAFYSARAVFGSVALLVRDLLPLFVLSIRGEMPGSDLLAR
jgi:hypothetical protein